MGIGNLSENQKIENTIVWVKLFSLRKTKEVFKTLIFFNLYVLQSLGYTALMLLLGDCIINEPNFINNKISRIYLTATRI